jgi:hypothetical protein
MAERFDRVNAKWNSQAADSEKRAGDLTTRAIRKDGHLVALVGSTGA